MTPLLAPAPLRETIISWPARRCAGCGRPLPWRWLPRLCPTCLVEGVAR